MQCIRRNFSDALGCAELLLDEIPRAHLTTCVVDQHFLTAEPPMKSLVPFNSLL